MYARSFGDVFSPAALIARASFSCTCIFAENCPSSTISCRIPARVCAASDQFERRWVHGHSAGVYQSHSEPEVKAPCCTSVWYCARVPRNVSLSAPSLLLRTRMPERKQVNVETRSAGGPRDHSLRPTFSARTRLACTSLAAETCSFILLGLFQPHRRSSDTTLGLERCALSIGGSNLVGALLAGNNPGHGRGRHRHRTRLDVLTAYGDIIVMEGKASTRLATDKWPTNKARSSLIIPRRPQKFWPMSWCRCCCNHRRRSGRCRFTGRCQLHGVLLPRRPPFSLLGRSK